VRPSLSREYRRDVEPGPTFLVAPLLERFFPSLDDGFVQIFLAVPSISWLIFRARIHCESQTLAFSLELIASVGYPCRELLVAISDRSVVRAPVTRDSESTSECAEQDGDRAPQNGCQKVSHAPL
jgi:hypothetical protein